MPSAISTATSPESRSVAVIGAGAGGLCAALELRKEGHKVVVYERGDQIGGLWVYTPEADSDPMSLDPARKIVHSSLYASLRTNLPREAMGFRQYPFVAARNKAGRDARRYPCHTEVLEYLRDFAGAFGLCDLVRFGREVWSVEMVRDQARKWLVSSRMRDGGDDDVDREVFDAVVVCVGHNTEPRIAEIPGIEVWPGKQIHSHNYRVRDPFRNQIVVIIGGHVSSDDISRDVAKVAKEVHISSRSVEIDQLGKLSGHDNIWQHSTIKSVREDGTVAFDDQTEIYADAIIHCTGYKYHFPFLKTDGVVKVEDNRVDHLYKHIFPPTLAPSLSFIGVPWKIVPFPLYEFQCKWIAGVLSGRIPLPSTMEMMSEIEAFYASLEASGIPKRYTHRMDAKQFEYNNWLASESGSPPVEKWREQMYLVSTQRRKMPEMFRDHYFGDQDLIDEAHKDFEQYGAAPDLI
ncbi:flavin-containing monooxygenase FMO GS-OX-like 2 [Andrographis paniculata]|uniref:flavin-containing monooxygenase FMO GS-OX-like 2 n=1 Tax=Andrographis paniculata TaxID=175694 RepID=UPI0021E7DCAF|nr:flavin-containing monooxygenase FMO GS-OX-like 2 [Andrographis paniculata]XP_051121505.1 flavin-containing monooxygenase FMO GS-OX-like 2 [Andrographis paniculata]